MKTATTTKPGALALAGYTLRLPGGYQYEVTSKHAEWIQHLKEFIARAERAEALAEQLEAGLAFAKRQAEADTRILNSATSDREALRADVARLRGLLDRLLDGLQPTADSPDQLTRFVLLDDCRAEARAALAATAPKAVQS